MPEQHVTITDDDLRDVLFEAGMAPAEIEANIDGFPVAKLVLGAITKIMINRLAQQMLDTVRRGPQWNV